VPDCALIAIQEPDIDNPFVALQSTLGKAQVEVEHAEGRRKAGELCRCRHADFAQVTADALDFALETLALDRLGLRDRLLDLYLGLAAFPDVPEALARVRAAGLRTAILWNGTPAMLDSAVAAARLAGCFDAVLSVEEVGAFKPDRRVYQLAIDRLGIPAGAIAFVSSNGWDAHAASAFGMQVVWCNRTAQWRERLPGVPDREIAMLAELPALVGA
jgi:2-haloacid dehalogenase